MRNINLISFNLGQGWRQLSILPVTVTFAITWQQTRKGILHFGLS
jgi:hypothetical protein